MGEVFYRTRPPGLLMCRGAKLVHCVRQCKACCHTCPRACVTLLSHSTSKKYFIKKRVTSFTPSLTHSLSLSNTYPVVHPAVISSQPPHTPVFKVLGVFIQVNTTHKASSVLFVVWCFWREIGVLRGGDEGRERRSRVRRGGV